MFYVYIISNNFRNVLYIGVTRNIERRLYEHKNKLIDGFSKKYNLNVLLFYETTEYALDAIAREKQLKKWNRDKKFALIKSVNPELRDLSEDWWFCLRFLHYAYAPVEMTYWGYSSSKYYDVNYFIFYTTFK